MTTSDVFHYFMSRLSDWEFTKAYLSCINIGMAHQYAIWYELSKWNKMFFKRCLRRHLPTVIIRRAVWWEHHSHPECEVVIHGKCLIRTARPGYDTGLVPSHWETWLQSNAVSHWLGANLESALWYTRTALQSILKTAIYTVKPLI